MRNGGGGKDRVVLLVGKEGKQRGGDMRETDEKNDWRDERGREEGERRDEKEWSKTNNDENSKCKKTPKTNNHSKRGSYGKWKDKFRWRRRRKRLNIWEEKNCDDRVAKHLTQQRLWTNSQM